MKNNKLIQQFNNFKSIRDLLKVFSTNKKCEKFLKQVRWGKTIVSPYDENAKVYECSRGRYRCANTGKDFNVLTGTCLKILRLNYKLGF